MVSLPQGIPGWTVFLTGLLIIAYRVHGIDNPRAWIEWTERQFTVKRNLQLIGGIIAVAAIVLAWYGNLESGAWLFALSILLLASIGLGLVFAQNHVRHIIFATAEVEDKMIRIVSVIVVLIGLLWALAPWFF